MIMYSLKFFFYFQAEIVYDIFFIALDQVILIVFSALNLLFNI